MNLYKRDYTKITPEEQEEFSLFDKSITVGESRGLPIKRACRPPKTLLHYESLFPNNYLDVFELKDLNLELNLRLEEFRCLLDSEDVKESDILRFIKNPDGKAYFIIASLLRRYDFGHHEAFLFPEFKLGNSYRTDFLIVGRSSNGYEFVFVEIESPKGKITTRNGDLGEAFRKGISQIIDWKTWLDSNFSSLKETFNNAKKSEEALPDEFISMNSYRIHYVVIAGRRSDFHQKTYQLRRSLKRDNNCLLLHYDNLIDDATEALSRRAY
ncbi:MAG: Shedu anti-phage system protein SduA domain-containing protein [Pseudanabaenaceae cyanobacterium]|jgi:hypothetical protein